MTHSMFQFSSPIVDPHLHAEGKDVDYIFEHIYISSFSARDTM